MVKLASYAIVLSVVLSNSAAQAQQLANAPRRLLRISDSASSSAGANTGTSLTKDEATRELEKDTTFNIAGGDPEEIINGEELPRGERPYLVELRWKLPTGEFPDGRTYQHLCGGTLIGPRTVLTAAHCFSNSNDGTFYNLINEVDIGMYDLDDDTGVTSFQLGDTEFGNGCIVGNTACVLRHPNFDPDYNPSTRVYDDNDYALIFLPQAITDIVPVELNADRNVPANAGDEVTAIGWGNTIPKTSETSTSLKPRTVTYEYVPNDQCSIYLQKQTLTLVSDNQMCAYNDDKGTCQGDSGGPLLFDRPDGTTIQVGITGYGPPGCSILNFPDVKSRVSAQIDWIRKNACSEVGDLCPMSKSGKSSTSSKSGKSSTSSPTDDMLGSKSGKSGVAPIHTIEDVTETLGELDFLVSSMSMSMQN